MADEEPQPDAEPERQAVSDLAPVLARRLGRIADAAPSGSSAGSFAGMLASDVNTIVTGAVSGMAASLATAKLLGRKGKDNGSGDQGNPPAAAESDSAPAPDSGKAE